MLSTHKSIIAKHSHEFKVFRNNEFVFSVMGFISNSKPNSIQLAENYSVKEGDWLIDTLTNLEYILIEVKPLIVKQEVYGCIVQYKTKAKYEQELKEPKNSNISIGTFHGNAIIGNQTNATMNIGSSIEDLKKLISNKSTEDQEELNKLVKLLETITDNNMPLSKGTLAKFSDILAKHQDIVIAVGGFLTTFFMSK
ncbi:hypothetical protein [Fusobacterium ulcerans]|uniref:hypothetical protein n=1 Tax=Fusobacterium ulcerans TaxID=861 RepID=UPI0026DBC5BF|nr:hypothetical protein [Fusobacterium ulcerans]